MEKLIDYGRYAISVLGTVLTYLFCSWDKALIALIVFMVLDYVTGVLNGWYHKKLSSNTGLHGLARKGIILVVLIVANVLDRLLNNGTWVFRSLVCYFYIANEGLSIIENCAYMGLPIPSKVKDALIQLKGDGNNENK